MRVKWRLQRALCDMSVEGGEGGTDETANLSTITRKELSIYCCQPQGFPPGFPFCATLVSKYGAPTAPAVASAPADVPLVTVAPIYFDVTA